MVWSRINLGATSIPTEAFLIIVSIVALIGIYLGWHYKLLDLFKKSKDKFKPKEKPQSNRQEEYKKLMKDYQIHYDKCLDIRKKIEALNPSKPIVKETPTADQQQSDAIGQTQSVVSHQ